MTANDILAAAASLNLADAADRAVLADSLLDIDPARSVEIAILRSGLPLRLTADGEVRPKLEVSDTSSRTADGRTAIDWVNCSWGGESIGGAWVAGGKVEPYTGSDMLGGSPPDDDYFESIGIALEYEGDDDELCDLIQRESVRLARQRLAEVAEENKAAEIAEIARQAADFAEQAADAASGCQDTADGVEAAEAADEAAEAADEANEADDVEAAEKCYRRAEAAFHRAHKARWRE